MITEANGVMKMKKRMMKRSCKDSPYNQKTFNVKMYQ